MHICKVLYISIFLYLLQYIVNLNIKIHIYTIFQITTICNEFNIVCSFSNIAHIHINRLFTWAVEKSRKSRESERPYCLYSPAADKAKGCYGSQLEPESNLEKPQSQHERVLRLGENEKKVVIMQAIIRSQNI